MYSFSQNREVAHILSTCAIYQYVCGLWNHDKHQYWEIRDITNNRESQITRSILMELFFSFRFWTDDASPNRYKNLDQPSL